MGYYCPEGSVLGIPCDPGKACTRTRLASPADMDECTEGYYCLGGASTTMPADVTTGAKCPAGHYCPAGSKWPTACPIGKYQEDTGKT